MRAVRVVLVTLSFACFVVAGHAFLTTVNPASRTNLAAWLIGVVVVHDAIIAPIVIGIGLVLARTVSPRIRPIIQGGLAVAALVTLISIPVVLGYGRDPGNPSLLPLDYRRNLPLVLLVIAAVTAALVAIRLARTRPNDVPSAPPAEPTGQG